MSKFKEWFFDLIKWSHTRYPMKAHSLCYKMVHLILERKQKWESYSEFNTSGFSNFYIITHMHCTGVNINGTSLIFIQPGLRHSDPLKSSPGSHSLLVNDPVCTTSSCSLLVFPLSVNLESSSLHCKVAWQQCTWCSCCARDKCGHTKKKYIYTNRRGKRRVILGPAGHVLCTRPAGKNWCFNGFNQEAIQCMRVILWLASYDHDYFIQTEFRPLLRVSCENFCWNDLELQLLSSLLVSTL